jgi:hypothetical protein
MRKKRILAAALALCLLLAVMPAALAAGTTLTLQTPETPAVGESFTVTVAIAGNPGVNAIQMTLAYDKSVVNCTKAQIGSVLKGALSVTNEKAHNGAKVVAASVDALDSNGTIATFIFTVLKDGDPGLSLNDVILENDTGNAVPYTLNTEKNVKTEEPQPDETEPAAAADFTDVPDSFWAAGSIREAAQKGLVTGFADGSFRPNDPVTRAQFVIMLWRLAGSPAPAAAAAFTDVKAGDWYEKAVAWAAEKGYVTGASAGRFQPDGRITREQAMAILFRYSGSQSGMELMLTSVYDGQFADSKKISPYAKSAIYWAVYQEIVTGMSGNLLAPQGTATRAQIAAIFLRYMDKISGGAA